MSKTLLLADDSVTIQKVVELIFAHAEYDLKCANNGNAALEQARLARPDIVLADVNMPGRNGYELCAAIKADPALTKVPVLMLAGAFEPFDEEKARSVGADGWIAKPFESQALIDEVEDLLVRAKDAEAPEDDFFGSVESAPAADSDTWGFDNLETPEEDETPLAIEEPAGPEESEPWNDRELLTEEQKEAEASPLESMDFEPEPVQEPQESVPTSPDEEFLFLDESDLLEGEPEETETSALLEADDFLQGAESSEPDSFVEETVEDEFEVAAEETLPEQDEVEEASDFFLEEAPVTGESAPAGIAEKITVAPPVPEYAAAVPSRDEEIAERVQAALTDEQLDRIVERVAGSVIERLAGSILEKIAWEVVPDLAEVMIKEEIRKITENSH